MKAIWNGKVLAQSDRTVSVEKNVYFPPESVDMSLLKKSGENYLCSWKGEADYYDVVLGEGVNHNAAWVYPEPSEKAKDIKGYFAFWKGVTVEE